MSDQPMHTYDRGTPDSVEVIEVIVIKAKRGRGLDISDPVRIVTQYWSLDGVLLAERDPVAEEVFVSE